MHARTQFQESDLFETLDQIDEPLKVLVLVELVPLLQVRAQQRQRATKVTDFVGNAAAAMRLDFSNCRKFCSSRSRISSDVSTTMAARRVPSGPTMEENQV